MKVALVGAEFEENLGLRYMAAALEQRGHQAEIVPFNTRSDVRQTVKEVVSFDPQITGLSMVFTGRAPEFCRLAQALRDAGYRGHIIAGGHFACFNSERILKEFPAFDSIGLGEGEEIICDLADGIEDPSQVDGLSFRSHDGCITSNPSRGNPADLDALSFPKRTTFHHYFGKPIANILSTRGCWRNCAFCSINAWYEQGGGKKFRLRSVPNIVEEMKDLYFTHGVRIFNFQDDNFFLPDQAAALRRFEALHDAVARAGIEGIAIAVKARPDSITSESIRVLDAMGLFRVFLGVENASENGLRNLNRKCDFDQIRAALRILNDFDVHVAFNILMFEPDTTLDDILVNLRFMERYVANPLNFCRAEVYAGTGLAAKLSAQGLLLGDYFGFDYRLKDAHAEVFHQIANHAFFERNFNDHGLHYFNMEVDYYFQILRRFHPEVLNQSLRAAAKNFIKHTNLDTYEILSRIYDFVAAAGADDQAAIQDFARTMRQMVDERGISLYSQGERIVSWMMKVNERGRPSPPPWPNSTVPSVSRVNRGPIPYCGIETLRDSSRTSPAPRHAMEADLLGVASSPIPYPLFRRRLAEREESEGR